MAATLSISTEALSALQKFHAGIEQPNALASNSYEYDQAFIAWAKNNPVFTCKLESFSSNEQPQAKIEKKPFEVKTETGKEVENILSASPTKLTMFGTAVISIPEYNSGKTVSLKMSVATAAAIFGADSAELHASFGEITRGNRAKQWWVSVRSTSAPNWQKFLTALAPKVGEPAANSNNRNQRNQNNKNQ